MTSLPISTVLVGAAILYLARWICVEINHWILARKLGCKPAHVRRSKLPLGLDNVIRMAKAAKRQELQNDDQLVYQEMGCPSTWVQNILGSWYHSTVDPENIKAILATQFKDFEMGPFRANTMGPLLGRGIFISDGKEWYLTHIGPITQPFTDFHDAQGSTTAHSYVRSSQEVKFPTLS